MRLFTSKELVELLKSGNLPADIRAELLKPSTVEASTVKGTIHKARVNPLAPDVDYSELERRVVAHGVKSGSFSPEVIATGDRAIALAENAVKSCDQETLRLLVIDLVARVGSADPDDMDGGMAIMLDVITKAYKYGFACAAGDALTGKIPTRSTNLPASLVPKVAEQPTATFIGMILGYQDARLFRLSKTVMFKDFDGNDRQTNYVNVSRLRTRYQDVCVIFPTNTNGLQVLGKRVHTRYGENYGQCLKDFGFKAV